MQLYSNKMVTSVLFETHLRSPPIPIIVLLFSKKRGNKKKYPIFVATNQLTKEP